MKDSFVKYLLTAVTFMFGGLALGFSIIGIILHISDKLNDGVLIFGIPSIIACLLLFGYKIREREEKR